MKTLLQVLIVSLALSSTVIAQDQDSKKAANIAKKQHPKSRVLKVSPKSKSQYRVKVLKKSGKVVNVDVNTRSGKVVQPKKKQDR